MTWPEVEVLLRTEPNRRFGRSVLDVRADGRHLPGSASLPVGPSDRWADALPAHELCERAHPLVVAAETPDRAAAAAAHLRSRGWDATPLLDPVPEASLAPGVSSGVLWCPDPYLWQRRPHLPPPDSGPVLDLGAGTGRDACYLAADGYDCLLLDRLPDALALAEARAARMGVGIRTRRADLRDPESLGTGFALVLSIRFLERAALACLGSAVAPGGMVVIHTFASSPDAGDPGRVRARFRLDEAELPGVFPPEDWSIVDGPHLEARGGETWIAVMLQRITRSLSGSGTRCRSRLHNSYDRSGHNRS